MPIITLSRGSKSGGLALANLLSEELNCYNLISREVLVKASEEYGITEEALSEAMNKPVKLWERSSHNPRHLYLSLIRAALLEYASQGCMIYHGNAGHFLLGDLSWVLKVRLIAPIEQRISMLQQAMDLDRPEAAQYISKVDEDRKRWTKFLYGEDWADPTNFDIVINLQTMSLKTACDTVCSLADSPEYNRTEERNSKLRNIALTARVEATLNIDNRTRNIDVSVAAENGEMKLTGKIADEDLRLILLETIGVIRGVTSVKDELEVG